MKRVYIAVTLTCIIFLAVFIGCYKYNGPSREKGTLKVGFIYDNDESTPYTYNFSLAKDALEKTYGEKVEIFTCSNVLDGVEFYSKKPVQKGNTEDSEDVIPEKIRLPKNLFVTGTVNIDETTYMFSPKVLDRSNVVEFKPEEADVLKLMTGATDVNKVEAADFGVAEGFTVLASEIRNGVCNVEQAKLEQVRTFLGSIYEDLQESGFEFAYRTVKEIRQYFAAAYELHKDEFNLTRTMDEQIVQKILPKIYGDRKQIGKLLDTLEEKCKKGIEDPSKEMTLSVKKIKQMKKRLDKYQYASFM